MRAFKLVRVSALATESIAVEDRLPCRLDADPVSFPVSRQCSVHLRRGNPLNLGTSISQFAKSALFLKEDQRRQEPLINGKLPRNLSANLPGRDRIDTPMLISATRAKNPENVSRSYAYPVNVASPSWQSTKVLKLYGYSKNLFYPHTQNMARICNW